MRARNEGTKKKNKRTIICGASNRYASARFSKVERFSPGCSASAPLAGSARTRPVGRRRRAPPSHAGASVLACIHPLELAQHLVSAPNGVVHRLLHRLLPEQAGLDLLLDRDVRLGAVAEAKPLRVVARHAAGQLDDR